MSTLLDSSELKESARLIGELFRPASLPTIPAPEKSAGDASVAPTQTPQVVPVVPEVAPPTFRYRSEHLEHALTTMCRRGGLTGAVVADQRGFALAVYNSPVDDDVIAAFTTVLGGALEKAATLLGAKGAENISLDIDYTDKVVLRRFVISGDPYFLMVLCPQQVDERSEVEISIDELTTILMS